MSIDRKNYFPLPVLIKLTINWSNKIQSMKVFICGPPRVNWDWEEKFSKVKKFNISVFSSDGGLYWIEGQKAVSSSWWVLHRVFNFDIDIHQYSQYLDKVCTMNSLYLKLERLSTKIFTDGWFYGSLQIIDHTSAQILSGEMMSKCSSLVCTLKALS